MRIDLPQCNLNTCRHCFDHNCTNAVANENCEYQEYRNKKDQGLIIELPIPIGSTIWVIDDSLAEPYGWKVTTFNAMAVIREWGKTVFATKEEAEKQLVEMRGE